MNQDQVKAKLLELRDDLDDFTVVFSGKSSMKVDGLYYPDKKEILLHNENFANDNAMMYTAIHEFAHHVQFTQSSEMISTRAHTIKFWDIFHKLLHQAEEKGIYQNPYENNEEFQALTSRIKEKFLSVNGQLMKDLGKLLIEAQYLCQKYHASFDDYVDRCLGFHRATAKSVMKVEAMNINPELGFENMKTVASIKDPEVREQAEQAFLMGKSPDMVKQEFKKPKKDESEIEYLMNEKNRIEKTLDTLTMKLAKIERKLNDLKYEQHGAS